MIAYAELAARLPIRQLRPRTADCAAAMSIQSLRAGRAARNWQTSVEGQRRIRPALVARAGRSYRMAQVLLQDLLQDLRQDLLYE